jgi:DNA mismatch endonuclease (patch repair protein)
MDFLTPERRSRLMSSVRQKGTDIELLVCRELRTRGYRFQRNVRTLPGSPDMVFPKDKLALFVDGDFWHGFRYPSWRHKIQPFWRNKIETNRKRDQRNFRRLRRAGWNVLRIWQHEIETDTASCLDRIVELLDLHHNRNNR